MIKFEIGQKVTFVGQFNGLMVGEVVGFADHVYQHTAAIYDFDAYPVISWNRNPSKHVACNPAALIAA